MNDDDEIMTAEEFFGGIESAKGAGCAGGLHPRKRRAKSAQKRKSFVPPRSRRARNTRSRWARSGAPATSAVR